ncbi:SulP family inorganic anion transporter [Klebsiella aerogenes]
MNTLRQDSLAGIVVFLVALPLCLGIAQASGLPPFVGLLTGIIGGLVVTALSPSRFAVSGPAAGLVTIVVAAIESLGSFSVFLMALVLAGVLQLLFGMLAGIGIGLATQVAFSIWRSHRHSLQLARYDDHYVLRIQQNLTFLHNPHLLALLAKIPEKSVVIVEHDNVGYLDPDVQAVLDDFAESAPQRGIRLNQWPLASR